MSRSQVEPSLPHTVNRNSFPNSSYSGHRPECASAPARILRTPSPRDSMNHRPVRLLRIFERKPTKSWLRVNVRYGICSIAIPLGDLPGL